MSKLLNFQPQPDFFEKAFTQDMRLLPLMFNLKMHPQISIVNRTFCIYQLFYVDEEQNSPRDKNHQI